MPITAPCGWLLRTRSPYCPVSATCPLRPANGRVHRALHIAERHLGPGGKFETAAVRVIDGRIALELDFARWTAEDDLAARGLDAPHLQRSIKKIYPRDVKVHSSIRRNIDKSKINRHWQNPPLHSDL
jgi:hypothetical protein